MLLASVIMHLQNCLNEKKISPDKDCSSKQLNCIVAFSCFSYDLLEV